MTDLANVHRVASDVAERYPAGHRRSVAVAAIVAYLQQFHPDALCRELFGVQQGRRPGRVHGDLVIVVRDDFPTVTVRQNLCDVDPLGVGDGIQSAVENALAAVREQETP